MGRGRGVCVGWLRLGVEVLFGECFGVGGDVCHDCGGVVVVGDAVGYVVEEVLGPGAPEGAEGDDLGFACSGVAFFEVEVLRVIEELFGAVEAAFEDADGVLEFLFAGCGGVVDGGQFGDELFADLVPGEGGGEESPVVVDHVCVGVDVGFVAFCEAQGFEFGFVFCDASGCCGSGCWCVAAVGSAYGEAADCGAFAANSGAVAGRGALVAVPVPAFFVAGMFRQCHRRRRGGSRGSLRRWCRNIRCVDCRGVSFCRSGCVRLRCGAVVRRRCRSARRT